MAMTANAMLVSTATQLCLGRDAEQARAFLQGVHCISDHCGGALNPEACTLQAYLRFVANEPEVWHKTLAKKGPEAAATHVQALSTLLGALEGTAGIVVPSCLLKECRAAILRPMSCGGGGSQEQQVVIVEHQPEDIIDDEEAGDREQAIEEVTTVPFTILDMKNAISTAGNKSSFYKLARHHAGRHGHGDDWPLMDYFAYVARDPEGWIVRDRPTSQSGESTIRRLLQMMRHALTFAQRQCDSGNREQQRVIASCRAAVDGLPDVATIAAAAAGGQRPQQQKEEEEEDVEMLAAPVQEVRQAPATGCQQQASSTFDIVTAQLIFALGANVAQIKAGGLPPSQAIKLCESMQRISQSLISIYQDAEVLQATVPMT